MGSKDKREKIARIQAGLESPVRHEKVANMIVGTIQKSSTDKQVDVLNTAIGIGKLENNRLRKSLEENAPKEMRKGIEKLVKKGKTPTVDLLLEEYRHEKSFQKLAASVGLDEAWFMRLAEDELAKFGE